MLTAKGGDLDEAEALDTGADDYLAKPFSFPVLVARIRALLRRSGGGLRRPCRPDWCESTRRSRRVWSGDTEVALTAREFDVLEFLVRRAGQVLSKDEILAGVWELRLRGRPEHRRGLRRTVAAQARSATDGIAPIETVRGAGYRLVDDGER